MSSEWGGITARGIGVDIVPWSSDTWRASVSIHSEASSSVFNTSNDVGESSCSTPIDSCGRSVEKVQRSGSPRSAFLSDVSGQLCTSNNSLGHEVLHIWRVVCTHGVVLSSSA